MPLDLTASDLINRLSFQVHLPDRRLLFSFFCSPFRNESSFAFEFNQSFDKLNCVFDPRVFSVFQAQQDISSIKNIAGETGKKLSSLASTLMTDLQDRIL